MNGRILSGRGDITFKSGDDVLLNAQAGPLTQPIIETSGTGTVYIQAANGTIADADSGVVMTANAIIQASSDVFIESQNTSDILLARINANSVSLISDRSILDNNELLGANELNIQATQLQMIALTGVIGGSDTANALDNNLNAIDASVDTLATLSSFATYVREVNGVTIDFVGTTVRNVEFNSASTSIDTTLEDMVSGDGHIKLQAEGGDITVNAGQVGTAGVSAGGVNDVLLQTLAVNGDIIVNAQVLAESRDITLNAGDDVVLNAESLPLAMPILQNAFIGTVFVGAANQTVDGVSGVRMTANAVITSERDVRVEALNDGDIQLGRINASSVSLFADRSIVDNNDTLVPNTLNIQALQLQMVADDGLIGNSDTGNPTLDNNVNAIDTNVDVLATDSALGTYVREVDGVTVAAVTTSYFRTNFNSTFTALSAALEDMTAAVRSSCRLRQGILTSKLVPLDLLV